MFNGNREKQAVLVDQAALSELRNYQAEKQTMHDTIHKISDLGFSFSDWQLLYDEAENVLDKKSFRVFSALALGKLEDLTATYTECLVVFKMAEKGGRTQTRLLEKMKKLPKTDDEKLEMEHLIENAEKRRS